MKKTLPGLVVALLLVASGCSSPGSGGKRMPVGAVVTGAVA